MLLRITDGTTTVTLSSGAPVVGCTYFPHAPDTTVGKIGATHLDGDRVMYVSRRNVTESAEIILEGTAAAIQSTVSQVQRLIDQAEDRLQSGMGPQVYVEYQAHSGDAVFRSELFQGRVTWPDNAARRQFGAATNTVEAIVTWERDWFWEGPEKTLQFVNQNAQTTAINSISIYNGPGGINGNTAQVYQIGGQLPVVPTLEIANASGATIVPLTTYILCDSFVGFTGGQHWLTSGATLTWTGSIDHDDFALNIPLADTLIQKCAGRDFRVLAGFTFFPAQVYVRGNTQYFNGLFWRQRLRKGSEAYTVVSGKQAFDLGTFQLPPGGNVATTGLEFGLSLVSNLGGNVTLDFLQFAPADNVRVIENTGFDLPNGAKIVDDSQSPYFLVSGQRQPALHALSQPVRLWPGRTNYLRFFLIEQGGGYAATRQWTVTGTYRERRLTV